MSPDERKLLEKTYDLAKENHEILTSMRRSQVIGRFAKILYLAVIIGLGSFALRMIQPYVDQLRGIAGTAQDLGSGASSNYASLIKELTK